MAANNHQQQLEQWLWATAEVQTEVEAEMSVYAILDGASIPSLLEQLFEHQPAHVCLLRGELEPDMAEVAPYLVQLEPGTEFTLWLLTEGWGRHWGVFAQSTASLNELRQHFRALLTVYSPEHQPLHFRYYDPRVLRVFLPTCQPAELAEVFGPVERYLLEAEAAHQALRFRRQAGALQTERLAFTAA